MAVADVQGGNKKVFVRGGRFGFCDAQERKKSYSWSHVFVTQSERDRSTLQSSGGSFLSKISSW